MESHKANIVYAGVNHLLPIVWFFQDYLKPLISLVRGKQVNEKKVLIEMRDLEGILKHEPEIKPS
jgi:hypothetical protein